MNARISDAKPKSLVVGSPEWLSRRRTPPLPRAATSIRAVDLFCGCGGLSLGVREAARELGLGFEVALAVDLLPAAIGVYRDNFGCGQRARLGDVREVVDELESDGSSSRSRLGRVDVLVAGPPCQGHSNLNNHTRRNDPRNGLYLEVVRFARLAKPRVVIIENVPAARRAKEEVVGTATDELRALGYDTASLVVNAVSAGVAQTRKRHVIVGSLGSLPPMMEPVPGVPSSLQQVIGDLRDTESDSLLDTASRMSPDNEKRARFLRENDAFDLPNDWRPSCHSDKQHSYKSMYGRMRWDEPAQTITTGFGSMGQGRYLHPDGYRTITPHEAARIQGFPDFFRFRTVEKRGDLQRLIGNAVPPPVGYMLAKPLLRTSIPASTSALGGES